MARRSKNWQERRRKRKPDDIEALDRIHTVIGDLLRMVIVGCGHCCADNQKRTTWR
uniref:ISCfr11 transposase C n=1 Tax=Citrobacter freundii TaxID=546 RepID=A0A1V0M1P2_CITFR|nr:ISCfr11 transposase C [Citrobacter freundii]